MRADGAIVTAENVKNAYLGIEKQDTGQTLVGLAEEHNRIMANVLKPGSLKIISPRSLTLKFISEKVFGKGYCAPRSEI